MNNTHVTTNGDILQHRWIHNAYGACRTLSVLLLLRLWCLLPDEQSQTLSPPAYQLLHRFLIAYLCKVSRKSLVAAVEPWHHLLWHRIPSTPSKPVQLQFVPPENP